ncbi:alpha/beta hydrolase [Protaetiibacter larvae]|uniref:Phospholipase n=1 Tax=Protaetiibacter larvae TaxID=2592654 RepID=A0A5C1Y799_9MICO|nr:dienelactone hydrolase family protein [Protaetiibacter larvae]QEO09209.1 phospholipase [Protaetiibacter larvae]
MTELSIDPELVVWSAEADARRERPLVIVLHGRGSHERDLAALFPYLPSGFVYASLRAPRAWNVGFAWFDGDPTRPGDPDPATVDPATDAVLEWLAALPWVPPRVGALGFSQGGALATHLLRRGGGVVSFAVSMAGFLIRGEQPGDARLAAERPPAFWGRGGGDPLFTPALVQRSDAWLPFHTTLTSAVYPGVGHTVSDEMLRDVDAFLRAQA